MNQVKIRVLHEALLVLVLYHSEIRVCREERSWIRASQMNNQGEWYMIGFIKSDWSIAQGMSP